MEAIKEIALKGNELGGKVYYVGGYVRDKILGIENKDIDIEVHGISPTALYDILSEVGEPMEFGKSFGVFSLKGIDIDIAMPRKERAVGTGHRDFEVEVSPFIGTFEAARRRDFTINALMEDVLTGEIVDHFGGIEDLKKGVIRHIDDTTFVEDPLRVLRAAQFAARFDFVIAKETVALCRSIDISTLSMERIEEELKKAMLKADKPSKFFEALREVDQLDVWFPEIKALIGIEQDAKYHPEGDVWVHTMEVIDRAAKHRNKASDAFNFMLLALTHDLGKIVTTEKDGDRIHSIDHERKGLPLVKSFTDHITRDKSIHRYLRNMVALHMMPNRYFSFYSSIKATNRMFDSAIAKEDLIWFALCDHTGDEEERKEFLYERLDIYEEYMSRPYVSGDDLIAAGLVPGKAFKDFMAFAHKLRLVGVKKDAALKQVLAYAKTK